MLQGGSGLEFFADVTYFYDYGTRNDYTRAEKLGSVLWKLFRCKSTISSEILSNFATWFRDSPLNLKKILHDVLGKKKKEEK